MSTGQMPASAPPRERAAAVRGMFGAIAPRYDLLNHLLSLNIDRFWRRRTVARLLAGQPPDGVYLDACAGTLDLSLALARRPAFGGRIVAADFSLPMLERGAAKLRGQPISPVCGDALRLPFPDGAFDGAMIAFGVRNLADLDGGLREFARVLRPGGRLAVLEFTTPSWQPFRALYLAYFRHILPWIGRLVSRHGSAYSYLPASVLEFPAPAELAARIESAGFTAARWETWTGGIVALHLAERSA